MERNSQTLKKDLSGRQNRNLLLACQRVNDAWMPVNPDLLKRIKAGLKKDAYNLGIEFLISEIKTDFALFTYCLKEVRNTKKQKSKQSGAALPDNLSPTQLLHWAGIDCLKEILDVEPSQISKHAFTKECTLQLQRFQEAMVGASAAQSLAEKTAVDPDLGYSTGLLRQLGLALIAWNYPKVYQKVMSALTDETSVDNELTRALGFAPRLLGIAMARQWSLAPQLRLALGDKDAAQALSGNQTREFETTAKTLQKICEVGEALARANNPKQYPTAKSDWHTAQKAIINILGPDGMRLVQEKIKDNCENYLSAAPETFRRALEIRKEPGAGRSNNNNLFKNNRYIKHCPKPLQEAFGKLYEQITPGSIAREQLDLLIKQVIPLAGFDFGCVFLINPESMRLVPRLTLGTVPLSTFKERNALSISTGTDDPVLAAYHCNTPIVESSGSLALEGRACIAGVVGKRERVGVLYLELTQEQMHNQLTSPLMCFKAISQALNDCLAIG
ncbi:HDOD domain-containing protein [Oligoflexia bacterium]|nr:HDOD domain-containing protein [Oligoflexia bacterium]